MHPLVWHKTIWIAALCVLMAFTLAQTGVPPAFAEESKEEKDRQRMLNREAVNALWRLKRALEKDGVLQWARSGSMSGGLPPSKPANSTPKNMKNLGNSYMKNPLMIR